jgi:hypothetical protein
MWLAPPADRFDDTRSGWSISGGSGIPDDELRRQIRVRLSEARLPAVDGVAALHRVSKANRTNSGGA